MDVVVKALKDLVMLKIKDSNFALQRTNDYIVYKLKLTCDKNIML